MAHRIASGFGFGGRAFAIAALVAVWWVATPANAEDDQAEIAKKLNNPIAALISVPFQLNYDENIGPGEHGERWVLNIQPVIPFSLSKDWNLISRTILPIVDLHDIPNFTEETGLGDLLQSVFFSPKEPTAGWIWGVGPVFQLPTATDNLLGSQKWSAGPTAVALQQKNGFTYGALVNHLWSFAENDSRSTHVNATFMQPFLSYTTSTFTTFTANTESTYDWRTEKWSVPINLSVTQLFKIAGQPMSVQLGARYWASSPVTGPEGWGARLAYTLVFPR